MRIIPTPKNCSIPGYKSRGNKKECKGISFHKLPTESEERHRWQVSINNSISIIHIFVVCTLKIIRRLQIMTYLHYSPGLLFLYVNPLSLAPQAKKHKDEDLTKQSQSYAKSLTKIHLESWLCRASWNAATSM